MKYSELGFRAVYEQFCAFPMKDELRRELIHYPGFSKATGILCYGFMDPEEGLSLAVLATGMLEGEEIKCYNEPDEVEIILSASGMEDEEIVTFQSSDRPMRLRFEQQIRTLGDRNEVEYLKGARGMSFIDGLRDPRFIDDVPVELWKRGLDTESVTVRITDTEEDAFVGTLREEPKQDFGVHEGEEIRFAVLGNGSERIACYKDFDAEGGMTEEDLKDGAMLRDAIAAFHEQRNEKNLMDVLHILRDSIVYIPCLAVENAEMPEGSDKDSVLMVPQIMKNAKDQHFLPVFSDPGVMEEFGRDYGRLQADILTAIDLANNSSYPVEGIVVNLKTDPFFVGKDLYEVLRFMKPRLKSEETEEGEA